MGRPSLYTQELADEICERLAEGESLRAICKDDHMPQEATVRAWAVQDVNNFYAQYAKSRDVALDSMVDGMLEIADDSDGDVNRDRLRVDTRKWYAAKLAPKRYGDKTHVEHSGNVSISGMLDAAEKARTPPVDEGE